MRTRPRPSTPFEPAWWCRGAHAQTTWQALFRCSPRLDYAREVIDLPDGDFVDVDWADHPEGPLVVLIHGLGGSSRSPYIRGLGAALRRQGFGVAAINLRGAGGRPNRRPKTYHSGHTADLDHVLGVIAERFPTRSLHAVGFSLGGNLLLKWLGEHPDTDRLRSAAAVSVPYRLDEAARRMNRGASRLYRAHLLRGLRQSTRQRHRLFIGRFDAEAVANARDFFRFDDLVTAPVNGFSGARRYYALCSSLPFLRFITVPTLLLHARDDPFMTTQVIPRADERSPAIRLELHDHGGHVGFVGGRWPWKTRYWLEERIPAYFASLDELSPVDEPLPAD